MGLALRLRPTKWFATLGMVRYGFDKDFYRNARRFIAQLKATLAMMERSAENTRLLAVQTM
jgi:hypothetical protein